MLKGSQYNLILVVSLAKLSSLARARLPASDFACPTTRDYPIVDPSHVASARSYYRRPYTVKCAGGKERVCARARSFGMLKESYPNSAEWREWCK